MFSKVMIMTRDTQEESPPILQPKPVLGDFAHCRSGDKGNRSNIGVVANDEASYLKLGVMLTEEVVATYLRPLGIGQVKRYALPKIQAYNFVIEAALGGGASRSLRLDTQGKALGAILMELPLPVVEVR
jgi:hypothetical protein